MPANDDGLQQLLRQRQQLDERIKKARAAEQKQREKDKKRLQFLIGAAVLASIENKQMTQAQVEALLTQHTSGVRDRNAALKLLTEFAEQTELDLTDDAEPGAESGNGKAGGDFSALGATATPAIAAPNRELAETE